MKILDQAMEIVRPHLESLRSSDSIENIIDRTIDIVSPAAGKRRAAERFRTDQINSARAMVRKYEAGSKSSRLSMWNAGSGSADAEIRGSLTTLRNRARDLVRNNPWAAHGVDVISTLVVGDGVKPLITHLRNPNSKSIEKAINLWSDWADTPACDYSGERNLVGLQTAVMDAVVTDGEVFMIRHKLNPAKAAVVMDQYGNKTSVPLQIQLLESDFLDHMRDEVLKDGSRIIQGVEFNPEGQRTAYHFFLRHPGDTGVIHWSSRETVRIPANRVRHIFRKDRLHQTRGVTWFKAVMLRLRELDVYEDATLKKQQIASCFSAFITDPTDMDEGAAPAVGDGAEAQEGNGEEKSYVRSEFLSSGMIERLAPGQDIKFGDPPSTAEYPEFTKMQLLAISAGLGITKESLTQDLSSLNFSSGRMGHIKENRKVKKWQNQILIAQMMDPAFLWWQEAADFVTPGHIDMSQLWSHWTRPAYEMIDPGKEVSANVEAISSNQTTVSEVLRSQGKDPETVFQERAAELKRMEALGIRTGSDARETTAGGEGGAANAKPKKPKGDEDATAPD